MRFNGKGPENFNYLEITTAPSVFNSWCSLSGVCCASNKYQRHTTNYVGGHSYVHASLVRCRAVCCVMAGGRGGNGGENVDSDATTPVVLKKIMSFDNKLEWHSKKSSGVLQPPMLVV